MDDEITLENLTYVCEEVNVTYAGTVTYAGSTKTVTFDNLAAADWEADATTSIVVGSGKTLVVNLTQAKFTDVTDASFTITQNGRTLGSGKLANDNFAPAQTALVIGSDGPVVVTVTDLEHVAAKYDVKADDGTLETGKDLTTGVALSNWGITTATDTALDLTVTVAGGAGLAYNANYNTNKISVQLSSGTFNASTYGFIVKVGDYGTAYVKDGTATALTDGTSLIKITDNVVIKASDITVTRVEKVAISAAKWDATSITIKFNQKVDKATAETKSNYTFTDTGTDGVEFESVALQADGQTVVLTFSGASVAAADTIALTGTNIKMAQTTGAATGLATFEGRNAGTDIAAKALKADGSITDYTALD